MPSTHRTLALGLTLALLAAPTAVAQDQDLRSPDTRDAATRTVQDLRSPDTVDAARDYAPTPAVAPVPAVETPVDWTPIVLAAGSFLLVVVLVAAVSGTRSRPSRSASPR